MATVTNSCLIHHFQLSSDGGCRVKYSKSSPFTHLSNSKPKGSPVRCQSTSTEEVKPKRNILDNASDLLTNFLSGGSLGSMPTAEGAVSDLFGKPLFLSL